MEELDKDMTPRLIGETWRKYPTETSTRKYRYGLYECQYCKKEFECQVSNVKNRRTISCGCLRGQNHNLTYHKFYNIAINMIQRCTNLKNKNYKDYGGRGVTVCEEWLDVATFVAWAEATHPNIENLTLDRIDNDKGYSPDNCRWVDKTTQAINRRMQKNNTSGYVGINYRKDTARWAASVGVNYKTLRIGCFNTIEEAVLARDNYIIENKLPHKLSTDYIKEK